MPRICGSKITKYRLIKNHTKINQSGKEIQNLQLFKAALTAAVATHKKVSSPPFHFLPPNCLLTDLVAFDQVQSIHDEQYREGDNKPNCTDDFTHRIELINTVKGENGENGKTTESSVTL